MNVPGLTDVCKNGSCESEDSECYRFDDIYESGKISSSVNFPLEMTSGERAQKFHTDECHN